MKTMFCLDPRPCGVADSGPIFQGQNVTLTCNVTYYSRWTERTGQIGRIYPWIGWQPEAGTRLSKTETKLFGIGGMLQDNVQKLAIGAEIPSYECYVAFRFRKHRNVATNDVERIACTSKPVYIWRTYFTLLARRSLSV